MARQLRFWFVFNSYLSEMLHKYDGLWRRHEHQTKFQEFIYEELLAFDFHNFMCRISLYIIILKSVWIPWPDVLMNNLEGFYHDKLQMSKYNAYHSQ